MDTERDLCDLRAYLTSQAPGSISGFDFRFKLALSWGCFRKPFGDNSNFNDVDMGVREATWQPPSLSFTLRRDRGIMDGKALFELQGWRVDSESLEANFEKVGEEYCELPQARPNLGRTSYILAHAITSGRADRRLRWLGYWTVEVLMERIVPRGSVNVPTMYYRWNNVRQGIAQSLAEEGWRQQSKNVFVLPGRAPREKTTAINSIKT
jgi:hypothetical protein